MSETLESDVVSPKNENFLLEIAQSSLRSCRSLGFWEAAAYERLAAGLLCSETAFYERSLQNTGGNIQPLSVERLLLGCCWFPYGCGSTLNRRGKPRVVVPMFHFSY